MIPVQEAITSFENKEEQYRYLYQCIESLIDPEADQIADMANICAAIHDSFSHHWVGFYRVIGDQLILGPFQGPVACTRIAYDKGVCGNAWKQAKTLIVDNVHEYPGHIACSSFSNSEIVVPVINDQEVKGVLDIDSTDYAAFDSTDAFWLEKIVQLLK